MEYQRMVSSSEYHWWWWWYVPWCSQMFLDVPRCSQMFPDVPRCSQMFLFSTFQALSTFSHIIDTCHLVSPGTTLYNLVPPGTTWHHPVSTSYRPVKNRISPQLWAPLFLSHICIYAQTNLIHLSIIIYTSQNTMTPRTLLPEQC